MYACVFSQPSECEQCTCDSDGIARCLVADCAPPPCVNPVYQPGKCCPECKEGKSKMEKNTTESLSEMRKEIYLLYCMSTTVKCSYLIICMQGCCFSICSAAVTLTSISLQVPIATLMRHAARWSLQDSPSGSTSAPSVAVTMARTPVTGRETVSPPVPASKTARLNNRPPRKTDLLSAERQLLQYTIPDDWSSIHLPSLRTCWTLLCSWKCQWCSQT